MRGTLYIQRDDKGRQIEKPKPIECDIDLGKDASAIVMVGLTIAAELIRARVEFISADGLLISGLEETHYKGIPAVRYQEWWFAYHCHTGGMMAKEILAIPEQYSEEVIRIIRLGLYHAQFYKPLPLDEVREALEEWYYAEEEYCSDRRKH